ncbi:hypothetical protein [Marimonas arenosa]|uniref:Uncharacterized protein n=1 Tax=Marimonas arenosa TaxID=1795305 RepID=A0AAE3WA90_9RHOB|nr:hypothetical protein [Marimonas arenosa]MDQ2088815.1 hypothetical protein [Marimonas arenosa]
MSAGWHAQADAEIGAEDHAWMRALPKWLSFRHRVTACLACHGGFSEIDRFLWPISADDGARKTRFALLESDGTVAFHKLCYEWQDAQAAMQIKGLAQGYHTALETGRWPSRDILPPALRH